MKVKKARWLALVLVMVMVFGLMGGVAGANGNDSISWTGQGMDSMDCDEYEPGTMHWVLNQARDVENPELVLEVDGVEVWSGDPSKTSGPVYHFDTPYFDPENLEATIYFDGSLGRNSQFVLSGYCPPECPLEGCAIWVPCGGGLKSGVLTIFLWDCKGDPWDGNLTMDDVEIHDKTVDWRGTLAELDALSWYTVRDDNPNTEQGKFDYWITRTWSASRIYDVYVFGELIKENLAVNYGN